MGHYILFPENVLMRTESLKPIAVPLIHKMGMQIQAKLTLRTPPKPPPLLFSSHCSPCPLGSPCPPWKNVLNTDKMSLRMWTRHGGIIVASCNSNLAAPFWDSWKPEKPSFSPSLSDILWPSAGAFAAMTLLGKVDQILAPKGITMTIAPFGAVCAVLFAAPSSPSARKYNMFLSQIGCAAIGVLALSLFGPGWLARSAALAASVAFMIFTHAIHPPAASLPLLFIDGAKFHNLNLWYAFFPGATGCIILCLIQEIVHYLKDNFKF